MFWIMFWKWTCFVVLSLLWAVTFIPITRFVFDKHQSKIERKKETELYLGPYGLLTLMCLAAAIWAFTQLPIFQSLKLIGWRITVGFATEILIFGLFKVVDCRVSKKPKPKPKP